jgi:hypothetical protein
MLSFEWLVDVAVSCLKKGDVVLASTRISLPLFYPLLLWPSRDGIHLASIDWCPLAGNREGRGGVDSASGSLDDAPNTHEWKTTTLHRQHDHETRTCCSCQLGVGGLLQSKQTGAVPSARETSRQVKSDRTQDMIAG